MNLIALVVGLGAAVVLGGGGAYILWLMTRTKGMTWIAKCYQVGEGTKKVINDNGIMELKDLIPYTEDILERKDKDYGIIVYELKKQKMTTNAVTADMVEPWSRERKEVDVLIDGSTATVLKKGYNSQTGQTVFTAMPRERIELIKSEIITKKDRLKNEKDLISSLTPWVVTGLSVLGLIVVVYFLTSSFIDMADSAKEAEKYAADRQVEAANTYREALIELSKVSSEEIENNKYGKQLSNIEEVAPPIE